MIYISSSCIKDKNIKKSLQTILASGIKNIELSGGTNYYGELECDLIKLKKAHDINFLCHNYFPPPQEHFVLNLASMNEEIYRKSLNHYIKAIELSQKIGSPKFALHAGFLMDISLNEIGKKISEKKIIKKEIAIERFCEGFIKLKQYLGDLELYIENNVYSHMNAKQFNFKNIFMLTSSENYIDLRRNIDFKLLLDVAHLKVSTKTLGLDFNKELSFLLNESDYIHLSENNGFVDNNEIIHENSYIWEIIKSNKVSMDTVTLEIYDDFEKVINLYKKINEFVNEE